MTSVLSRKRGFDAAFGKTRLVSHLSILDGMRECAEEARVEELRSLIQPELCEAACGGSKSKLCIDGDRIWNEVQEVLVHIFPQCWTAQELIVQALVAVNVRRIYTEQFDFVMDRLMREQEWSISTLANILLIICPRRFGKTKATAAVVAALLICVPYFKHVHFSLTLDFAAEFQDEVKAMVMAHPAGRAMLQNASSQVKGVLTLRGSDPRDIRTCKILAAKEKYQEASTSRGYAASSSGALASNRKWKGRLSAEVSCEDGEGGGSIDKSVPMVVG